MAAEFSNTIVPVDVDEQRLEDVNSLLEAQQTREGRALYLHDQSIEALCPELLADVGAPTIVAPCDVTQVLPRPQINATGRGPCSAARQYPSIFVGAAGTGSPLHVDQFGTRFWMVVVSGHKRWVLFPPEQARLLYPKHSSSSSRASHAFSADVIGTDPQSRRASTGTGEGGDAVTGSSGTATVRPDLSRFPLLRHASGYEGIVGPGDLVFAPEGWIHQVHNLDDTIAVAGNWVDDVNLEAAVDWLHQHADVEDGRRAAAATSGTAPLSTMHSTVDVLGEYLHRPHDLCPPPPEHDGVDETWPQYWERHARHGRGLWADAFNDEAKEGGSRGAWDSAGAEL